MSDETVRITDLGSEEKLTIESLWRYIRAFIIFYTILTAAYLGFAAFVFFIGLPEIGLAKYTPFAIAPVIIAIAAQGLAKELYGAGKKLKSIFEPGRVEQDNIAGFFRRLKNYFLLGALFLFFIITLFLAIVVLIVFN